MKKGFTLIEMIAVVAIIALLMITVIPSILNQIGNKKEEMSNANKEAIYTATDNYLDYNSATYPMNANNTYCITLEALVNAGELKSPIKDFESGNEIPLNTVVKAVINGYRDPEYSIVGSDECSEVKN